MISAPRFPGVVTFAVACLAYSLLTGCNSQSPPLSPLAADARILAFGDSLTKGTGGQTTNYPAELAKLTGLEIINAGIPGELSDDGLKRLPRMLEAIQPQLVILCHGGNDLLRKKTADSILHNLEKMVSLARAQNAEVVLIGVPKPGLLLGTADFYIDLAKHLDIPIERDILADVLSTPTQKSGPIHPNDEGYRRLAAAIHALLQNSGALL